MKLSGGDSHPLQRGVIQKSSIRNHQSEISNWYGNLRESAHCCWNWLSFIAHFHHKSNM